MKSFCIYCDFYKKYPVKSKKRGKCSKFNGETRDFDMCLEFEVNKERYAIYLGEKK